MTKKMTKNELIKWYKIQYRIIVNSQLSEIDQYKNIFDLRKDTLRIADCCTRGGLLSSGKKKFLNILKGSK